MDMIRIRFPAWSVWWGLLALATATIGCHTDHRQSMLHPASPASGQIAWLWWFLLAICSAVFIVVLLLTWIAVRPQSHLEDIQAPSDEQVGLGDRFILWSGGIIPSFILIIILLVSVGTQKALERPETTVTIEVIGHQFWWEVHYPDQGIEIANEIYIPVGEPVHLKLRSADVIHSFWAPNLQGKTDMLPEKVTETWIQSDRPGIFRGQCAEYCGVQHALMAFEVIAVPRDEFDQWLEDRQRPIVPPTNELLERGRQVFVEVGCNTCHSIGDQRPTRKRGPDLTHFGNRNTVGAGILPNNRGNLAGWISNPQAIKPGNEMPRTHIESEDLHALVAYLESLK